ncbi:hypothetical protein [Staphylococcus gallinarum]|uniref:hypothetical protein n=1 Tax=Staphylococcus gallinarum TaxID=1293 RepID=UPI000D1DE00B|nr:hypothetical protein [Staphylococcus gallinarum]PTK89832.1 hypothetical protein BUZ13_11080 [Staphylococcus gallinarum]PTK92028.1 hypothetical protein BUZ05_08860 [Staphylococcus gallinarum]
MKNFFLAIVTLLLIALLGTAIYIYNNPKAVTKITGEKKQVEKRDSNDEETTHNTDTNSNNTNEEGYNKAKPINEMTQDEYDSYLLTQTRSYLTKEQQDRYDYLMDKYGITPGDNAYHQQHKAPTHSTEDQNVSGNNSETKLNKTKDNEKIENNNPAEQQQVQQAPRQEIQQKLEVPQTQKSQQDNSPNKQEVKEKNEE